MTEAQRIKKYKKRLENMRAEYRKQEKHWKDLAAYFMPVSYLRKALFGRPQTDSKDNPYIYDLTGRVSLRVFSSGLHGGLTSPSRPWFGLGLTDEAWRDDTEVEQWLNDTQNRISGELHRSNFYDQIHLLYSELGCFGVGVMMLEEDEDATIRFETLNAGEYYLSAGVKGRVDTLYRIYNLNARQMMDRWAREVPEFVKRDYESDKQALEYEVLHVIEPRRQYDPMRKDGANRPWRSLFILLKGGHEMILEESGYYEQPFIAARWEASYNEIYGSGPASDVLSTVKSAQQLRKDSLIGVQMELNPPVLASADLGNPFNSINLEPGGITYVANTGSQPSIIPAYQVRHNLAAAGEALETLRNDVRDGLYYNLFLLLSGTDKTMTATEVAERNAEKLLQLGPALERMRSELFMPMINRVFNAMFREGKIASPPESLQGQDLKVEFISMLALAQKAAGLAGIDRLTQYTLALAQVFPQEVMDVFDVYQAVSEAEKLNGVNPGIIRSADEVEAIRQAREQQQQQMMAQQQAMAAGQMAMEGMSKGAGAMKDAAAAGLPIAEMMSRGQMQ
ncbi:MAG: head-tail connector protein [Desulfarculales bacterium]|jgi:hypothetical protein|nr:head-tail connector protein [Desulfarculales bacterium]